jgi:chromosome segregation ATPase
MTAVKVEAAASCQSLAAEKAQLEGKVRELAEMKAKAEACCQDLTAEMAAVKAEAEASGLSLAAEKAQLEKKAAEADASYQRLEVEKVQLEKKVREMTDKNVETKDCQALTAELAAVRAESEASYQSLMAEKNQLEEKIREMADKKAKAEASCESLTAEFTAELETKKKEADVERMQLEQSLAKLTGELERLSRQQQVPHFINFLSTVFGELRVLYHRQNFRVFIFIMSGFFVSSVADPGCLSRIPDPTFYHPGSRILDPGSELSPSRIPDPHQRI